MSQSSNSSTRYDRFAPEAIVNPYPLYRWLQEEEPVYWDEARQQWIITRYDDVFAMLRDPQRFSSTIRVASSHETEARLQIIKSILNPLVITDPPSHTHVRRLAEQAFTPDKLARMRERTQQIVDSLLDKVQANRYMDVVRDLSAPLPFMVMVDFLGVSLENNTQTNQWTYDFFRIIANAPTTEKDEQQILKSLLEMNEYFSAIIEQRRSEPKPDLITALVQAEEGGDRLEQLEIITNTIMVFTGGFAPANFLISNGIRTLLLHPEQMQKLQSDSSLIESAIDELLRYESPLQWTTRRATEQLELHGRQILKDQVVIGGTGAANRDPAQFTNPEQLDISRQDNRHIAFGAGPHLCIARHLACMVGQIAISTVLRRIPNLRLESDTPEWEGAPTLRGPKSVPVTFT